MEQKRTLWIIVAAGVFLLVVLGAACILYTPAKRSNPPTLASSTSNQSQMMNSGWTPVTSGNANLTPAPIQDQNSDVLSTTVQNGTHTNELTVISDNTVIYDLTKSGSDSTTIDLNALRVAAAEAQVQESVSKNLDVKPSASETVENTPAKPSQKAPVPPTEEPKPAKVAKQETPKPAAKSTVSSEKKAASAPAKTPAKKTEVAKVAEKKAEQFWVQAASYSAKKTAENARAVLDDNKIPADIFTYKDANGKVFYRVRVGPYTTKSEAEYWRTRIVKINEFADGGSYITTN